jgi:hypothetical protein
LRDEFTHSWQKNHFFYCYLQIDMQTKATLCLALR